MHLPHDHHLSYVEAEDRLAVCRPSLQLRKERLRWTGHVLRSDDTVLYEALTFIPEGGARRRGRPRRRFYDTIKEDIKECGAMISAKDQIRFWEELSQKAADRTKWRTLVYGEARMD